MKKFKKTPSYTYYTLILYSHMQPHSEKFHFCPYIFWFTLHLLIFSGNRISDTKHLKYPSTIKTWTRNTRTGGSVRMKACLPVSYLPKMVLCVVITHVLLVRVKGFMLHQHLFLQDHSFDVPIFSNKVSFLKIFWVT